MNLKILLTIVLFFLLLFDFYILTNPTLAPFPKSDYQQYISGQYSGYGLSEVFTFLDKEKTLTDKEIDGMMNKIMAALEKDLNAEIRK